MAEFDDFTRWKCPHCGGAGIDSFHKTIWDGLPWESNTPPTSVPGLSFFCPCCNDALVVVRYPGPLKRPIGFVICHFDEERSSRDKKEKQAWTDIENGKGAPLEPSDERDCDWSGGCCNLQPSPKPQSSRETMIMDNTRERFWMVWRENSPETRHRHWTKQSALDEAERLSQKTPGETFYVLKATAATITDPTPARRLKLVKEDDQIPF